MQPGGASLHVRVERLTLDGPYGRLNLIAVHLDPASAQGQLDGIACIRNLLDTNPHNVVAGERDFVE